ncbi:hypothetical protein K493DRAFT_318048 [Basidiobolus meristosporus CBS 931.73]|uniref:Uncharacterized protein n=1 Tax=Basidiobolus meristosporus CBS 931.73 TaxID=1314790 RepID=A0A1Y1XX86_9FUNG|nr:hypothetical protein K493DRAFT_318048 [Basidiobolus meristosporus CBS 931.73]|eukprot:ORX90350.1 hypothetical protein K493DRAFT_318048 [Basidiobolus meristosporus CBS 931.73]
MSSPCKPDEVEDNEISDPETTEESSLLTSSRPQSPPIPIPRTSYKTNEHDPSSSSPGQREALSSYRTPILATIHETLQPAAEREGLYEPSSYNTGRFSKASYSQNSSNRNSMARNSPSTQPINTWDQYQEWLSKSYTMRRRPRRSAPEPSTTPNFSPTLPQRNPTYDQTIQRAKPSVRSSLLGKAPATGSILDYFAQRRESSIPTSPTVDDVRSEFEVTLDNGTTKKQTVSMTTTVDGYRMSQHSQEAEHLLPDDSSSDEVYSDDEYDYSKQGLWQSIKAFFKPVVSLFSLTPKNKNVLKASIAYFLATLFTFVPFLRDLLGDTSTHLAATAIIFFNPARRLGAFIEGCLYGIIGLAIGGLIAWGSCESASILNGYEHHIASRIVSIIVFCGGGTFVIAFLKAKFGKPTVNTGASIAYITLYAVLIKQTSVLNIEFTSTVLENIIRSLFTGLCVSLVIAFTIWPISGGDSLRANIAVSMSSFRLLLKNITKTFLLDPNLDDNIDIQAAMQAHRQSFAALKTSLSEAHLEFFNWKVFYHLDRYNSVVKSLNRLSQHLSSMSSGIAMQEGIVKRVKTRLSSFWPSVMSSSSFDGLDIESPLSPEQETTLAEFIRFVGPPLRSLAYAAKQTIIEIQATFSNANKMNFIDDGTLAGAVDFALLQQNLHHALKIFEESQTQAVAQLYQHRGTDGKPNENVFIVYFFVFSLQEFTKELIHLVGAVRELEEEQREAEIDKKKYGKISWWIRRMWKKIQRRRIRSRKPKAPVPSIIPEFSDALGQHDRPPTEFRHKLTTQVWSFLSWFRQFEVKFAIKTAVFAMILSIPAFVDDWRPVFRAYRGEWALISMAVILVPTVGASNVVGVYRVLCNFLGGFLAGVFYYMFSETTFLLPAMVFLISIPCWHLFLNSNYPRVGQFTLLTFNVILLNKIITQDDDDVDIFVLAFHRAIAVSVGVAVGLLVTSYVWPYEARVELRKGLSDFFRDTSKLYHKLIAVYSSPIPIDPSTQNSDTYSISCRSLTINDFENFDEDEEHDEDSRLLNSMQAKQNNEILENSRREFMDLELSLQISLLNLQDLLSQTPNEPRLKGPFPQGTYALILASCQTILDRLLALRIAVTKKEWFLLVQEDFLFPTNRERRHMAGSILLYFYIISSAFKLKTALPPYLPPAAKAHQVLVEKIRELDVVKSSKLPDEAGNKVYYVYYYAYVVSIEEVIRELDRISGYMYLLFGCEGGTAFQHYFQVQP